MFVLEKHVKKTFQCYLPIEVINKTNKLRFSGRFGQKKRGFYDAKTRGRLDELKDELRKKFVAQNNSPWKKGECVLIECHFIVKDRRNQDLDNKIKTLLDALVSSGILYDDKYVVSILSSKIYEPGVSGVFLRVSSARDIYDDVPQKKHVTGRVDVNFLRQEFACKCGCGFSAVDAELLEILRDLRIRFGRLKIESGCRCKKHNSEVGGKPRSYHMRGLACDFRPLDSDISDVFKYLEMTYSGCGMKWYRDQSFIHIDVRGYDSRW